MSDQTTDPTLAPLLTMAQDTFDLTRVCDRDANATGNRMAAILRELHAQRERVASLTAENARLREDSKHLIICAAVKFADGRIVRAHRHDGCYLYAERWTPKPDFKGGVQGFIDSRNQFVTRAEARQIAEASGQVTELIGGNVLTSEDLW